MTRAEIITNLGKYFKIEELVCDHIYQWFVDTSWMFLDTAYLHTLLVIRRDIIGKPMTSNVPAEGTHQRGLRCNMCPLVRDKRRPYLSAHVLGKAGDFVINGMSAEEARCLIIKNAAKLPYPIRIERNVTWLHFDVLPQYGSNEKIYQFTA